MRDILNNLDDFLPEQIGCKQCGDPECGICKTCKGIIISGITCCSCAKSGKELNGWWYNGVNHMYRNV